MVEQPDAAQLLIGRPGLRVMMAEAPAMATVMARDEQALRQRIAAEHGLALPSGGRCSTGDGITFIATAPGTWLALADGLSPHWPNTLAVQLGDTAAVVGQSGAYLLFRLEGEHAAALLQKGVFIDLHPGQFTASSAAVTVIAHIGVILWRPDDQPGNIPHYRLAVPRSLAVSFRHWLESSVALME